MLLMRWFSIEMKTLFAIFPVLTSSNRPALIAIGDGGGEGDGVWACDAVVVKREIASAIAPAASRVLFIRRAESGQTLLIQSKGEKSKA